MSVLDLQEIGEQPTEELKRGGRKSRPLISQNFWDLHSKKLGSNSARFLTNLKREFNAPLQILTDPCRFFCHIYLQSAPSVLSCIDKSLEGIDSKDFFGCYTGFFLFCKKREAEQYVTIRYVHKDSRHYLLCFKMFARRTIRFPDEMFMKDQKESEDLVLIPEEKWKNYKMMSREKRQPVILGTVPDIEKISGDSPVAKKPKKRSQKDENFEAVSGSDESESDSGSDEEVASVKREAKRHKKKRRSKGQGEPGAGSDPSDDRQAGQSCAGASGSCAGASGSCAGASGSCAGASGMGGRGKEQEAGPVVVQNSSGGFLLPKTGSMIEDFWRVGYGPLAEGCPDPEEFIKALQKVIKSRPKKPDFMSKAVSALVEARAKELEDLGILETSVEEGGADDSKPKRRLMFGSHLYSDRLDKNQFQIANILPKWLMKKFQVTEEEFDKIMNGPPLTESSGESLVESGSTQYVAKRRQGMLADLKHTFVAFQQTLSACERFQSIEIVPKKEHKGIYILGFLQDTVNKTAAELFPGYLDGLEEGTELKFAVLGGLEALLAIPSDDHRVMLFRKEWMDISEITEESHPDMSEDFCTKSHLEICKQWDLACNNHIKYKDASLHEIAEIFLLDIINLEVEKNNVDFEKQEEKMAKQKQNEERRNQEGYSSEFYGSANDGGVKRSKRLREKQELSLDMQFNPSLKRKTAPKAVKIVIIPLLFYAFCGSVNTLEKGFLHAPGCPCIGQNPEDNPIVTPWFNGLATRTVKRSSYLASMLTIPNTLLGLCDCVCSCIQANRCVRD